MRVQAEPLWGRAMPRQARLDAPSTLHHVIIRGIEQRRIVDDDTDREEFVQRMGRLAVEPETVIYAWSLMTNHAHILLGSGAASLSSFMRRFFTGYAISYNLLVFLGAYTSFLGERSTAIPDSSTKPQ